MVVPHVAAPPAPSRARLQAPPSASARPAHVRAPPTASRQAAGAPASLSQQSGDERAVVCGRAPPAHQRVVAAHRRVVAARAGYWFHQSVEDGTLTYDSGYGRWSPQPAATAGGSGGGSGAGGPPGRGGGGGGSDGAGRSPAWRGGRGYAWVAALFMLAAKSLLCWCSEDPKAAATALDLGFLLTAALLAWASLSPTPLGALRLLLVEFTVAHLVLEMLFYGVLLPLIDPAAEYRMAPEMWLHHVASVLGGLTAAALAAGAGGSVFAWLGAQMVVTEITTFLPVAFHQALKSRRMRGARSVVLGVLMPLAFGLRVVLSARVVVNLLLAVNALGGAASVPLWCLPLGLSTSATILGLNVYWLGKILAGSGRAVLKQRRAREVAAAAAGEGAQAQSAGSSGAGAGAAPRPRRAPLIAASAAFSDATGAAVYSELLEQKRRRPRPGAAA